MKAALITLRSDIIGLLTSRRAHEYIITVPIHISLLRLAVDTFGGKSTNLGIRGHF